MRTKQDRVRKSKGSNCCLSHKWQKKMKQRRVKIVRAASKEACKG